MAPDPRRWGGKAHGHPWGNPGERDGAHYEQRLITRVFQGPWELWREPGRGQRPSVCLPTPQLSPPGCQTTLNPPDPAPGSPQTPRTHATQRSLPTSYSTAPRPPGCPSQLPQPVPPPSPALTRAGSQECPLAGCCSHTQSLVNGVSPPLANPAHSGVCAAHNLLPKRVGRKGESDCRVEDPRDSASAQ